MNFLQRIFRIFVAAFKKRQMINIVLFGPPGSGKGTQAELLVKEYNIMHVSTGDLFRYEMGNNTPLGLQAKEYMAKGELVPDSVTIGMLQNKVNDNPDVSGIIFDGFPRNIVQAEALNTFLQEKKTSVSCLIALEVPEGELLRRLLKRGQSSGRADDIDEDIIRNRIKVYHSETTPVFDYYALKGKSVMIDGQGSIEEIFSRIKEAIKVS